MPVAYYGASEQPYNDFSAFQSEEVAYALTQNCRYDPSADIEVCGPPSNTSISSAYQQNQAAQGSYYNSFEPSSGVDSNMPLLTTAPGNAGCGCGGGSSSTTPAPGPVNSGGSAAEYRGASVQFAFPWWLLLLFVVVLFHKKDRA